MKPTSPETEPGNGLSGSPRGRTPKLTPTVHSTLKTLLQAAATPAAACQAVGIDPRTFENWMKWGQEARRGIYRDFFREMTVAIGMGRVMVETKIAADKPLEYAKHVYRKEPEWAPLQDKIELSGTLTHEVDAELESVLKALVDAEVRKKKPDA